MTKRGEKHPLTLEQSIFFEKLYREQFNPLVVYAYRFLGDWGEAEVAVQKSFLIGLVKIDEFCNSKNPVGWIRKTIRNTTSNMNQAKNVRSAHTVPLDETKQQGITYDRYEGVNTVAARCAEILTPEEYALLKATIMSDEPISKVYQKFGLSYEACRKRVSRILQKLRKNWDL